MYHVFLLKSSCVVLPTSVQMLQHLTPPASSPAVRDFQLSSSSRSAWPLLSPLNFLHFRISCQLPPKKKKTLLFTNVTVALLYVFYVECSRDSLHVLKNYLNSLPESYLLIFLLSTFVLPALLLMICIFPGFLRL